MSNEKDPNGITNHPDYSPARGVVLNRFRAGKLVGKGTRVICREWEDGYAGTITSFGTRGAAIVTADDGRKYDFFDVNLLYPEDQSGGNSMSEKDPNGIPAGEPGSKLDDGKNRLGLVLGSFANALWAVGEVGTYGAKKYCDHGWLSVESGVNRYTDAMLRHYFKEVTGEQNDPDTHLLHAAHTAWNALARLELMIREQKKPFEFPDVVASIKLHDGMQLPERKTIQIPSHINVEVPERFR